MSLQKPQSTETGLVGMIVRENVKTDSTTIYAEFTDKKTGVAREPQAGTLLFTLDKDDEKFEMILADSHTTTDGVTEITVATNGRGLFKYGNILGAATGNRHVIGKEIGIADIHIPLEVLNEILRGNEGTGANDLRVGDETDSDITFYAQNADTNKPFIRFDKINNKWVFSNDGTSTTDVGGGTGTITAGDGIDITVGVVKAAGAVQVSSGDTNANYLEDKLVAGTGITLTKNNTGADETLEIDADLLTGAIDGHYIYTPAYLTGGTSPTTNYLLWKGTTDGEFSFTINGVAKDVTGLDFSAISDMDGAAAVIQAGVRTATSSTETCVWDTDHFIIHSVNTTSASAVTVLDTVSGGTGTDISGVSAGDPNMDCDTGNGVVTDKVLDVTADSGKVVKTESSGNLPAEMILGGTTGSVVTSSGAVSSTSGVKFLKNDNGTVSWASTLTYSHGYDTDTAGVGGADRSITLVCDVNPSADHIVVEYAELYDGIPGLGFTVSAIPMIKGCGVSSVSQATLQWDTGANTITITKTLQRDIGARLTVAY